MASFFVMIYLLTRLISKKQGCGSRQNEKSDVTGSISAASEKPNMYRSYKHLDESIDRIVFEDRSGEIYELWERE